jgi:hypothetical protein
MSFDDQTFDFEPDKQPVARSARRVSGSGVVLATFAFGITATAGLWTYWTLHTGPFRPLQDALAKEFPGSVPRVDGGQRKMHKGTPTILRAVLRVYFDPVTETAKGEQILDRVEQLSRQHIDLSPYDVLDVYLYEGVPEQAIREREFERQLNPHAK